MKNTALKITISCLIILLVLAGISYLIISQLSNQNIKIKDILLSTNKITLEIGDKVNLNELYSIYPINATCNVMCLVLDSKCANINNDNILTAKTIGTTKVLLKASSDNNFIEKDIEISVTNKEEVPTSISFEKELVTLSLKSKNISNKITLDCEYNGTPTISYSNEGICSYNYITGVITPKSCGETYVKVKYNLKESTLEKSFKVVVKDDYVKLIVNATKENDYYVLNLTKNKVKTIKVQVYENDAVISKTLDGVFVINQNNTKILQHDGSNFVIKVQEQGESILKIFYPEDESIFINIKIIVEA